VSQAGSQAGGAPDTGAHPPLSAGNPVAFLQAAITHETSFGRMSRARDFGLEIVA
jgi:hypothetical protein